MQGKDGYRGMKSDLEYNLYTKRRLEFRADGAFRILMMSDVQERADFDPQTLQMIERLIDRTSPDLIVFGGDNVYGPDVTTEADFKTFLSIFTRPMEERGIAWAHVFGNHDHDLPISAADQQRAYEAFPCCVSKHTEDIGGVTNFVLPIYRHASDDIAFNVWGMDTNRNAGDFARHFGIDAPISMPNAPVGGGGFGMPYFEQLMWYWNSSVELEKHSGAKIPGLMCMHTAPYEFTAAAHNPELCSLRGTSYEGISSGPLNCGIFAEILQRGDIRCICCGHTHRNDFEATYCGIRLCFDATAGLTCYGDPETRGGRIFDLNEADPWEIKTRMVHYSELT